MSRTVLVDGVARRKVIDLKPGDRVDLEGDLFADPWPNDIPMSEHDLESSHPEFAYEFETVLTVDSRSQIYCWVEFESGFACGFGADHMVGVDGEQEE